MEEKDLNYLKQEYAKCFKNGVCINEQRRNELLQFKEIWEWVFSRDRFISMASQEEDMKAKSTGELFLQEAYPPSWYWEMPDYYYPGFYSEFLPTDIERFAHIKTEMAEYSRISSTTTRNEAALIDLGWHRKKYDILEYYNDNFPNLKIVFNKDNDSVLLVRFNENNETVGEIEFPFSMICAVFLKCRELEYKKPYNLRAHDLKERFPDLIDNKDNTD